MSMVIAPIAAPSIKGESKVGIPALQDGIFISSWNFAAQLPMKQDGSHSSNVVMNPIAITKALDKSTLNIMLAMSTAATIPSLTLSLTKKLGTKPVVFMTLKLTNAQFIGSNLGASAPDQQSDVNLQESHYLTFDQIDFEYFMDDATKSNVTSFNKLAINKRSHDSDTTL